MFNIKNPFRERWCVESGIVLKIDSPRLWTNLFNPLGLTLFDSLVDAEDYAKFYNNTMTQHEAVVYLMESYSLTVAEAARLVYYHPNPLFDSDEFDQEDFEVRLTRFIAQGHPITKQLSTELGSIYFFNIDPDYLFNLKPVALPNKTLF